MHLCSRMYACVFVCVCVIGGVVRHIVADLLEDWLHLTEEGIFHIVF